jgi:hypothetical protein
MCSCCFNTLTAGWQGRVLILSAFCIVSTLPGTIEGFGDVELSHLDTSNSQPVDPSQRRVIGNNSESFKIIKPVGGEHMDWKALNLDDYRVPVMTSPWQRHDTVTNGVYPRMIVIGCQKCGTASLFVYLSALKSFIPPISKELHAFR